MRLLRPAFAILAACSAAACVPGLPGGTLEGTGGSSNPGGTGNTAGTAPSGGSTGSPAGMGGTAGPPTGGAPGRAAGGAGGAGGAASNFLIAKDGGRGALNVAVDASYVYWASNTAGAVVRVPVTGGQPAALTTICGGRAWVAIDSRSVYCAVPGSGGPGSGIIGRTALFGSEPTMIASGMSINQLAVGRDAVYWTTTRGEVMTVGLEGGSPTTLAAINGNATSLAVDDANVYWVNLLGGVSLTVTVLKVAASGGDPVELARFEGTQGPSNLALDGTYVYWADRNTGAVVKVPVAGGPSEVVFTMGTQATSVAVDASGVYWIGGGGVYGGTPPAAMRQLATTDPITFGLAVNATGVYWSGILGIYKAPR